MARITETKARSHIRELFDNGYSPAKLLTVCTVHCKPGGANWLKAVAMIGDVCELSPFEIEQMIGEPESLAAYFSMVGSV